MHDHVEPKSVPLVDSQYFGMERREMLAFMPTDARLFLDVGCGTGAFGALLRGTLPNARVVGIEMVPNAAAQARENLDQVIEGAVETAIGNLEDGSFDCIVCNDVLEHLIDPWDILRRLHNALRPDGSVVASIPNVRHFPVFKNYFFEADWKYEKWGVMDRTHLRFFTKSSVVRLFTETGYVVDRIEGIFGWPLPWKAAALSRLMGGRLDDMQFERFAVVARRVDRSSCDAA